MPAKNRIRHVRYTDPEHPAEIRCYVQAMFKHLRDGTSQVARKEFTTTLADIAQAQFDLKNEIERELILDILAFTADQWYWPETLPTLAWQQWNAETHRYDPYHWPTPEETAP